MKSFVASLCGILVLTLASQAFAQDGLPSSYEHLKALETFVGKWKTEVAADKEIPGVVKKGETLTMHLSFKWILKKNALDMRFHVFADKKPLMMSQGLVGWQAGEKQIVSGSFNTIGGSSMGFWTQEGNGWRIKTVGVETDGQKATGTIVLSNITENSFVSQEIDLTKDGKELPDGKKTMWKRVK